MRKPLGMSRFCQVRRPMACGLALALFFLLLLPGPGARGEVPAAAMREAAPRSVAMLLLRGPLPSLRPEVIRGRRDALFPGDADELGPVAARDGRPWPILVQLGGEVLFVMQIEAPIPAPNLSAVTAASPWWPEAAQAVDAHRAHLVIGPLELPMAEVASAVASARRVTRLAAIVAAEAGPAAIGVLWTNAGLLHPAAPFVDQARAPLPLQLWIDMQPLPGARRGETGFVTRGLRALIGRELRLEPNGLVPVAGLARRGLNVAAYLLNGGGAALRDGDTIGTSMDERMRIRVLQDPALGGPIYSLTVESVAGGRR